MDKLYFLYQLIKQYRLFTIGYFLILIYLIYHLIVRWNLSAEYYSDNVVIELFVGLIVSIIPLIVGLDLGRKTTSQLYHFKFRDVLRKIAIERESGKIKKKAARRIVIELTKHLGENITDQKWYEKIEEDLRGKSITEMECGVCGLKVEADHDKCNHCKLNCFAWKKSD